MAIDPQLLEILACPVCKVSVTLTGDKKGLRCGQCLRIYPIQDDIPIMLVEEAIIDKKRPAPAKAKPKPKSKAKKR